MNAALCLWWGATHEQNEIFILANDLEQATSRVFSVIVKLLRFNPNIDPDATIQRQSIQLSNGTVIKAMASEYSGAAGSNLSLVSFDELWGYVSERSQRLYEELTSFPPGSIVSD